VRVYVRHPSEFPVELRQGGGSRVTRERLHDLSNGGLCCRSSTPFEAGERVRVRIPVGDPGFEGEGRVAWCRPHDRGYRVGIEFVGEDEAFRARMVEQVCHIERYHRQLLADGRETSEEESALEWIAKYAARFPR
jgi:Tfp pilus assembly protein PilZ